MHRRVAFGFLRGLTGFGLLGQFDVDLFVLGQGHLIARSVLGVILVGASLAILTIDGLIASGAVKQD